MFAGAIDHRAECDDAFANLPMGLDNAASGYKIEFTEKNTKLIEIVGNLWGNPLLPVIMQTFQNSYCAHQPRWIQAKSQCENWVDNGTEVSVILLELNSRDKNSPSDMSKDCCRILEITGFLQEDTRGASKLETHFRYMFGIFYTGHFT